MTLGGSEFNILDVMNPLGMFRNGKRMKQYSLRDVPAFSAKLLPEFDKRRNIRDMFKKPTPVPVQQSERPKLLPSKTVAGQASDQVGASATYETVKEVLPLEVQSVKADDTSRRKSINSPEKRRSTPGVNNARPLKRARSDASSSLITGPPKGQKSLKGFFQPKNFTTSSTGLQDVETEEKSVSTPPDNLDGTSESPVGTPAAEGQSISFSVELKSSAISMEASQHSSPTRILDGPDGSALISANSAVTRSDVEVHDPIISKESWSRLFTKPSAPRCEGHDEPCISLLTKKSGFNCGRSFWICPR